MDAENKIIAGTYQLIGKLGSGGGGVIYLAEHLRLHKKVVLKVDKRSLASKMEDLRREVDALKDLNHASIPRVYDFVVEDGNIYTVMDYIEGESFDHILKRGTKLEQADVVKWACQLLEALMYLHSQPPHGILHADIKPANVMLTPQGDVRLIDFNIALALGEEGSIAVGRSFGYASPEHYGIYYAERIRQKTEKTETLPISTIALEDVKTVTISSALHLSSGTSGKKSVLLDVRSDIYSLGATLYHMITGNRPNPKGIEHEKIEAQGYSQAVLDIVQKAMNPNAELRYQSAKEMLAAFDSLWEKDIRFRRYQIRKRMAIALTIAGFVIGGATTALGLKQMENLQKAYVLSEYSHNYLQNGQVEKAIEYALQALPEKTGILEVPRTAVAQKALTDALAVYDLADGFRITASLELPSAPLYVAVSPDARTAAMLCRQKMIVVDLEKVRVIDEIPMPDSALAEIHYADNHTLLYAGIKGITAYDIMEKQILWVGQPATKIAVSENGSIAAAIYKSDSYAVLYEVSTGKERMKIDFSGKKQAVPVNDRFANPENHILALNRDGSKLAVSFAGGSLHIYDSNHAENELVLIDESSDFTRFEGGFYEEYFAFSATNARKSVFAVVDTEKGEQTGGFETEGSFHVKTSRHGICLQTDNLLVKIDPVSGKQTPLVTTPENILGFAYDGDYTLISTEQGLLIFNKNASLVSRLEPEYSLNQFAMVNQLALLTDLNSPVVRLLKNDTRKEADFFRYDPAISHDELRISQDGQRIMLFDYRKFSIFDRQGVFLTEQIIPNAEELYDQQFRRTDEASYLELIYNDGLILKYSAEDGSLLSQEQAEKPDLTLKEEFLTRDYRIVSPLHGVPQALDRKTGKEVATLEKEYYLTYVTEIGDYIITEYVSAEGKRHGLLLNRQLQTLAELPYLCDIWQERLIFDYPNGAVRISEIYELEKLIAMARKNRE